MTASVKPLGYPLEHLCPNEVDPIMGMGVQKISDGLCLMVTVQNQREFLDQQNHYDNFWQHLFCLSGG